MQRRAFVGRQRNATRNRAIGAAKFERSSNFRENEAEKPPSVAAERADKRKSRRKRYRLKTFDGGASRRFFSANGRRASKNEPPRRRLLNITQTRRQKSLSFRLYAGKLEKTAFFLKKTQIYGVLGRLALFFRRLRQIKRRKKRATAKVARHFGRRFDGNGAHFD